MIRVARLPQVPNGKAIKPIETRYSGHRFRSRLEARWAVFLDELGIFWEYEKEGYVLPDGQHYLPDFWLPDANCFLEIKPDAGDVYPLDQKCAGLSAIADVLLVVGSPNVGAYHVHPFSLDRDENNHGLCLLSYTEHSCRFAVDATNPTHLWLYADEGHKICGCCVPPHASQPPSGAKPNPRHLVLESAYRAATEARFEFGESGAKRRG
jgi:hypothetical protein